MTTISKTFELRLTGMLGLLLAVLAVVPEHVAAQSAIDGYDPNANGYVSALCLQPDGKMLVGGNFTEYRRTNA